MALLLICSPPAIWYLSKDSFPRISKLCGFVSIFFGLVLLSNIINSI